MNELFEFSISRRTEEIKRILDLASPLVIWPAEEGIAIVAANRDKRENRIHSIYDRIACVTLGSFSGGTILWQDAALRASTDGFGLSRGDVPCRVIIKQTAALLSESFHDIRKGAFFGVAAVFVEVADKIEDDYLAHVDFKGFVRTFSEANLFGKLNPEHEDSSSGDDADETAEKKLLEIWNPKTPLLDAVERMRREECLKNLFSSPRVEIVVMDRATVKEERFNKVFRRIV